MAKYTVESSQKFNHGTLPRYKFGKCRCADCRAANAAYARHYKATRKRRAGNPGLQPPKQ